MAVIKKSAGDHIFDFINAVFMCFMIVITLYPFIYVVMASLSVPKLFLAHTGLLLRPVGFSLESYEAVLRNPNIKIGYVNTVFIVVVGTLCNVIATAIGAYVLSRKGPFWKGPLMFIIVITMFVGGGLVPNYILIQNLGLYNSLWSLILPGLISTHNMIVMRTAFQGIPESLEESARIDGANPYQTFRHITMPYMLFVTGPALVTDFVKNMNNFNVIYLLTQDVYTTTNQVMANAQAREVDLLVTWLFTLTQDYYNYKMASVIGIMVFVVCAVITLVAFNFMIRGDKEEGYQ